MIYDVGDQPTMTGAFTASSTGAPTNPSSVQVKVRTPGGVVSTYAAATVPAVTNPAVGTYQLVLPAAAEPGEWSYRFEGTGAVVAAGESSFTVVCSAFGSDPLCLDVIDLGTAKRALDIPEANTSQDGELVSYVTAVSEAMDDVFGPVVRRTVAESHDGGRSVVFLAGYPVASVTSAAERAGTTSTSLTAEVYSAPTRNDFLLETASGLLHRRSGGRETRFAAGTQNVVVNYVAGRFASTAAVSQQFKQGAAMMLSHLWRPEQGLADGPFAPERAGGVPGWAVPRAVLQLLARERRAPVVVGTSK